jgi:hypothetical protein
MCAPTTQREAQVFELHDEAKARIQRQVARRKIDMGEELLREAFDTFGRPLPQDVFRRMRRLFLDYDLFLKLPLIPRPKPVDSADPAEEETLP